MLSAMKKLVIRIFIALLLLLILAVVAAGLFMDSALKNGVETVGPELTKVAIKLDSVSVSIFSGSGKIDGLVVGNPEGFQTPNAIKVGSASLSIAPSSLLSEKIVIKSIRVESAEITYESGLLGGDNLSKILDNVTAATSDGSNPADESGKPAKKLQVDDFLITGAKINVSLKGTGGFAAPIPLPDIHLTNLGQGPDGITAAELIKRILTEVSAGAAKAAVNVIGDVGKGAVNAATGAVDAAGKTAAESAGKIASGVTDLFKKK